MSPKTILVVDDEADVAQIIRIRLRKHGFEVLTAKNGREGLEKARKASPDLVLLDLMLPDIDGLDVFKTLRADSRTRRIPVIMLTAKSASTDEVVGLELGADDYVTKPFDFSVLFTRIKKLLAAGHAAERPEAGSEGEKILKAGRLTMDELRQKAYADARLLPLTTLEFRMLVFFMRHPGRVFSRDEIMNGAWKEHVTVVDRAVDVHINGIRKKLGALGDYIETVRGAGYRFKEF